MSLRITKIIILFFLGSLTYCNFPPQGVIILCAGDSITAADYPRFLHKILKKEGIRAKVINCGQKGHTSGEYLNYLEEKKKELALKHPDFILIQLGTNDVRIDHDKTSSSQYYLNMKKIIHLFSQFHTRSGKTPHLLLGTVPPLHKIKSFPFSPHSRTRIKLEINPTIEKICKEENLCLVDNYSLFYQTPELLPGVHPTPEGYKLLAQNWYQALKKYL